MAISVAQCFSGAPYGDVHNIVYPNGSYTLLVSIIVRFGYFSSEKYPFS